MWKYISGVYTVVHEEKNEKAPNAVGDKKEYEKLDDGHGHG